MKRRIFKYIAMVTLLSMLLTGCNIVEDVKVKLGFKNEDFEYISEGKASKIIIQSTRDRGFRFEVTDKKTIRGLYDILSSANKVDEKSELDPDYIFEVHIGEEIEKFNYIVGLNKKGEGNFYNDNAIYEVSKRLDNDIIQNLSFVRKPREFENIYYKTILMPLLENKSTLADKKIGIDLNEDVDCKKYILSIDLEDFKRELEKNFSDVTILKATDKKEDYDVIVTPKNAGYLTKTFKTIINIDDRKDKTYNNYYMLAKYQNSWEIEMQQGKAPKGW